MTPPDNELLRRFAAERSEPAFADLVDRYVGLVFSAALRQMDGDSGAAEDVTQAVFTDLARKAAHLTGHTSLTGWLYTSTRYLTANARREEHRRRQREQEAHMMDLHQSDGPVPDWDQLRPVLDEAMHELGDSDREAVLLRFFQKCPLAEVGERLGVGENAARMRVDRALDKLRGLLARRGLTSTAAALGAALAERTMAEVPAGLAARVSQAALAGAATGGGLILTLLMLMARTKTKVLIAAAVAALLLTPVVRPWFTSGTEPGRLDGGKVASGVAASKAGTAPPATVIPANDTETAAATAAEDATQAHLKLILLTADTGKPVPNVVVERGWVTDAKFLSQRDGTVRVTYPTNTKELRLTTRLDGFADTCLKWNRENGQAVPETYTLRLERAVPIGGTVVDPEGKPQPGAKVSFGHGEIPSAATLTETHEFLWLQVTTDEQGRWRIDRFAEDILPHAGGGASHPDYVDSESVTIRPKSPEETALRQRKYVFHLQRGATVTGMVEDTSGNPIPEAKVRLGMVGMSGSREGTAGPDGSFVLRGCKPTDHLLSAEAKGYAAVTEEINLAKKTGPYRLVLKPGNTLRLRVVGNDGQPIAKAYVVLSTLDPQIGSPDQSKPPRLQAEMEKRSDSDGRVVWEEAPDTELVFSIMATGHFRVDDYKVRPDGQEHTVTLPPALTIFGSVRDAQSGATIPRFRIISGWPQADFLTHTTNPAWSPLERFSMSFGDGEFRHTFEEGVIMGGENPGYIFRFESEGFAPLVTRVIAADEGEVRLDVALRPAQTTTITLVQPDGRPAANAEVALISTGGQATLTLTGFSRYNGRSSIFVTTDRNGRFALPSDGTLALVVAVHPEGFAQAPPTDFVAGQTTWALQPWGKIEGKWLSGDQPAADRDVLLESMEGNRALLRYDFTAFKATTDRDGNFHYDQVPPGRVKLTRLIRSEMGNGHTSWGHARSTEVDIRAGETTPVTFGGTGYRVIARAVLTDGKESALPWQFYGSVHTPIPMPPPEVEKNPEAEKQWWLVPEHQQAAKAMKQFMMAKQPDGTLLAEEVEPGDYVVTLGGFALNADGKPQANARTEPIPLSVADNPATGLINLGVISLRRDAAAP